MESYLLDVKARIHDMEKKVDDDLLMSPVDSGKQFSFLISAYFDWVEK